VAKGCPWPGLPQVATKLGSVIIDAVVANDEIDLARFRLSYLAGTVSKFYIAESAQTFQGRAKPLNFAPLVDELRAIGGDVEVVNIPQSENDSSFRDAWERGRYQRYWFLEYVAQRHRDDAIIFTDIDEVPSTQQLTWAEENLGPDTIFSLPMTFVFRFANWLLEPVSMTYQPGVILRGTAFRPNIRDGGFAPVEGESGAHLSYVGFTADQVKEKFSSFEHVELDVEHLYTVNTLDFANEWGIDHIGRPGQTGFGLLRAATEESMNSVLRGAIHQFPAWEKAFPKKSLLRRLVASSALSSFRSSGDATFLADPSKRLWDLRFLRHLASVGLHTLIRLTKTGTLIKRLQERSGQ